MVPRVVSNAGVVGLALVIKFYFFILLLLRNSERRVVHIARRRPRDKVSKFFMFYSFIFEESRETSRI